MNKGDLAESAEISRVSISKYFSGKRSPSPKTVGKIAKALNVPVSDIIENATAMADNAQWGIPKENKPTRKKDVINRNASQVHWI